MTERQIENILKGILACAGKTKARKKDIEKMLSRPDMDIELLENLCQCTVLSMTEDLERARQEFRVMQKKIDALSQRPLFEPSRFVAAPPDYREEYFRKQRERCEKANGRD